MSELSIADRLEALGSGTRYERAVIEKAAAQLRAMEPPEELLERVKHVINFHMMDDCEDPITLLRDLLAHLDTE